MVYPLTFTQSISIHAPRTGSDRSYEDDHAVDIRISIHAPRTGSDEKARLRQNVNGLFQSTLPARGATRVNRIVRTADVISIHAPRTGSDVSVTVFFADGENYFNPRSPHGERRFVDSLHKKPIPFQSTLPARGAT